MGGGEFGNLWRPLAFFLIQLKSNCLYSRIVLGFCLSCGDGDALYFRGKYCDFIKTNKVSRGDYAAYVGQV